jgi:hypothetical protein
MVILMKDIWGRRTGALSKATPAPFPNPIRVRKTGGLITNYLISLLSNMKVGRCQGNWQRGE